MGTLGQAYSEALQMLQTLGDEAKHVAAERAEACRRKGDEAGVVFWDRVTAFVVYIANEGPDTIH